MRRVMQHEHRQQGEGGHGQAPVEKDHATAVASTVVTFETIEVAVVVTTFWTPPMSLAMRDCTSPVRVRVKNASDSRWRWS